MTPRVVLACNPYPGGSTATPESWECWAPDWAELLTCYVERDAPETLAHTERELIEDGLGIGMPRPLPFVRDLLWEAYQWQAGVAPQWIGVANMDLHWSPDFFEVFDQAESEGAGAIAVHRRDRDPSTGQVSPVTHWKSMDAFFVTSDAWREHNFVNATFPKFLLGAPAWDMGAKAWTLLVGVQCLELDDGSVLHNTHTGLWRQRMFLETEGEYNRKLFRGLMERVNHAKVPPGALHMNPRYWSAHG